MKFLETYDGQTVDELLALEATYRIDSLVLAFESAIDNKRDAGGTLSDVERVILTIEAMERSVNNGGFSQFFWNSSAEFTPYLVESLNKIGCMTIAKIAQNAVSSLGLGPLELQDVDAIDDRMAAEDEALESRLDELDDEYYQGVEDIAQALFEYIKNNREHVQFA